MEKKYKNATIALSIISAILVLAAGSAIWWFLYNKKKGKIILVTGTTTAGSATVGSTGAVQSVIPANTRISKGTFVRLSNGQTVDLYDYTNKAV